MHNFEYYVTTMQENKVYTTHVGYDINRIFCSKKTLMSIIPKLGETLCLCGKEVRKGRTTCATCSKRAQREKFPIKAAFYDLRTNSARRGIYNDLTLEEFTMFCMETEYMKGKGKMASSYSIDRVNEELGYTAGNLQCLTLSENTKKENLRRKRVIFDIETRSFYTKELTTVLTTDCPF